MWIHGSEEKAASHKTPNGKDERLTKTSWTHTFSGDFMLRIFLPQGLLINPSQNLRFSRKNKDPPKNPSQSKLVEGLSLLRPTKYLGPKDWFLLVTYALNIMLSPIDRHSCNRLQQTQLQTKHTQQKMPKNRSLASSPVIVVPLLPHLAISDLPPSPWYQHSQSDSRLEKEEQATRKQQQQRQNKQFWDCPKIIFQRKKRFPGLNCDGGFWRLASEQLISLFGDPGDDSSDSSHN